MKPCISAIVRLLSSTSLCLALGMASMPVSAKTEHFALDPVHTRIAFQVSHAGFSNPVGTFSGSTGTLDFDEHDWTQAKLEARIAISSLDLGDSHWQKKILDRTFFDAGKFPEAHFISTRVEPTGPKSARVTGDLTLHGVTHPVTLEVTLNALGRHPLTFRRTIGFSAIGKLSRKDFGIDAWKSVVGDEVRLLIEVEGERAHSSDKKVADGERPQLTDEEASDAAAK